MNGQPLLAFGFENFAAVGADEIVFPLASGVGFLPFGINQAVTLQPVQNGIQHPVAPLDLPAAQLAHFLDDFVAVAFAPGEDGEQQRFRGGGHHVFSKHGSLIHCTGMYVNKKLFNGARRSRRFTIRKSTGQSFCQWSLGC